MKKIEELKNITLNGVEFTPEMLEELRCWSEGGACNPQSFVQILSDVRDFLCNQIVALEVSDKEQCKEMGKLASEITRIRKSLEIFTRK